MTEKIFRSILLASMAALLLCVILILGVLYSHFNDQLAEEMQNELAFIASGIEASGEEYLAGVSSQNQIVWLAPNGSVLYSSGEVGDISQNAEVRSAFESGFGQHEYAVPLPSAPWPVHSVSPTDLLSASPACSIPPGS